MVKAQGSGRLGELQQLTRRRGRHPLPIPWVTQCRQEGHGQQLPPLNQVLLEVFRQALDGGRPPQASALAHVRWEAPEGCRQQLGSRASSLGSAEV